MGEIIRMRRRWACFRKQSAALALRAPCLGQAQSQLPVRSQRTLCADGIASLSVKLLRTHTTCSSHQPMSRQPASTVSGTPRTQLNTPGLSPFQSTQHFMAKSHLPLPARIVLAVLGPSALGPGPSPAHHLKRLLPEPPHLAWLPEPPRLAWRPWRPCSACKSTSRSASHAPPAASRCGTLSGLHWACAGSSSICWWATTPCRTLAKGCPLYTSYAADE